MPNDAGDEPQIALGIPIFGLRFVLGLFLIVAWKIASDIRRRVISHD